MKSIIALIILLLSCSTMTSCNIAAVAAYIVSPDPEQLALYKLSDVRTVVFVDDRRNVMHPARLKMVIADRITNDLLVKKIVNTMISPRDIFRVSAANDRYNDPLSMGELGKAVDASVLIYVEMSAFGLTSDGKTANPRASCTVRVLDCQNNKRLFPLEQAAHQVTASIKRVSPHQIESSGEIRSLTEELAEEIGDSVAKLFYDHNIGRLGENLNRK
ncbi:MAG: hypothetical protein QF718_01570 [Phycisphaerales bacterium]|jgi:hypothetical protein|nr:hypothetical protein [Phycisphaerales bacterium]